MNTVKKANRFNQIPLVLTVILSLVIILYAWIGHGFDGLGFDTDFGRDLMQISNIQQHKVVWLGPWLGPGFHASSIYYYLYYPAVALGKGHPYAMIWFNIFLSFTALFLLSINLCKKYKWFSPFLILVIGLSPWMIETSLHPGNGFTYAIFSLLALTYLHFDLSLIIAGLFTGFATSFHPAAFLIMPILIYRWWKYRSNIFLITFSFGAFLFPWVPLIAFEIITKGYIIRRFFAHPSSGVILPGLGIENLNLLSKTLGLPLIILISLTAFFLLRIFIKKKDRISLEYLVLNITILIICFIHEVPYRYLYPISILVYFSVFLSVSKYKIGQKIIVIYASYLFIISPIFKPFPPAPRTVPKILQTVNTFEKNYPYLKEKKLATVAALWLKAEVPQADDYRALLRNRGYTVVDITQNNEADYLIMFIEEKEFDWKTWVSWEIGLFGEKKFESTINSENAIIAVYSKK